MDEQRRAVIINEIRYWKENHLLPDHYCDFLFALYTEGEQLETTDPLPNEKSETADIRDLINPMVLLILFINLIVAPLAISVIYLLQTNWIISVIILLLALIMSIYLYRYQLVRVQVAKPYIILILLLNIFAITVYMVNRWVNHYYTLAFIVFLQLFIWLYLGIKQKNYWLIGLSIIGFGASVATILW
ncbi:hypothetical protein [Amphibacillus sediminis]|uniref:hypothetical protein n=1 Tax=Amphibacillus sediminis TaxID=360185 RepID=UPI00082E27DE|nr:hypothetical protein [Amphibacillus sediminis]